MDNAPSTQWQVGDLALCADLSDIHPIWRAHTAYREGNVYRVRSVVLCNGATHLDCLGPDVFAHCGHPFASRFRKILPDEHEACEEEFRILLQLSKQRVAA